MRKASKRESMIGLGRETTVQEYREIAIGISRKYMRGSMTFRMDEDKEDEGDVSAIADEQVEHASHVANMIYARGIMSGAGWWRVDGSVSARPA